MKKHTGIMYINCPFCRAAINAQKGKKGSAELLDFIDAQRVKHERPITMTRRDRLAYRRWLLGSAEE